MDVDLEKYGSIDNVWRDRADKKFFGEVSRPIEKVTIPLSRIVRAHEFRNYIDDLSEARSQLLLSDTYLSPKEAYNHLALACQEVLAPADVDVLRESGTILSVPDHGMWLYPQFQFNPETGRPSPLIKDANESLDTSSEWEKLGWWHLPRTWLDGESFAKHIHSEEGEMAIRRGIDALH